MPRRFLAMLLPCFAFGNACAAYNASFCNSVAGTMNIHWEATGGAFAGCTGIEFTNGTLADASDGNINMNGTSVSNPLCIGTDNYTFTMGNRGFTLAGFATAVPMSLTRTVDQDCFVGNWVVGPDAFQAYIWAGAFAAPLPVPATDDINLALLAGLLAMSGGWALHRRPLSGRKA